MHPLLDLTQRPIVGHRGNCAHAPENTIESFRQAVELGVDALELDVRLTADGEVVVIHDPSVDRTTDGRGLVAAMTLAELQTLDAGARFTRDGGATFPYRGRGIRISTLDEVMTTLPATPLLIEIKTPAASAGVKRAVERHGAAARVIVDAFEEASLTPFRGGPIAIGSSAGDVARLYVPALARRRFSTLPYRAMCIPRTHRGIPLPLRAMVRAVAPAGVPVHVWTINDHAMARRLWAIGVRGIISDDPGAVLTAAGRVGTEKGRR
jgi:glycerophosphoryl diester phosphodiesterase